MLRCIIPESITAIGYRELARITHTAASGFTTYRALSDETAIFAENE